MDQSRINQNLTHAISGINKALTNAIERQEYMFRQFQDYKYADLCALDAIILKDLQQLLDRMKHLIKTAP